MNGNGGVSLNKAVNDSFDLKKTPLKRQAFKKQ